MLIKASGTWLINSLDKDIFVEVDLNSITQKINNEKEDNFVDDIISKNNLHPSSETSFHALIKYKYVLHVHSTATIANAISQSSESDLKKYLDEEFIFIPYCRPGFTLTMEIKKLILPSTNILILENHGLIVAGDDIEDTYKLLLKIHKKLDLIRNENLGLDYLEEITNIDGYNHKNTDKYKLFSTHNEKFISLFPKSFYPDHVIFLGPGIPTFLDEKEANEFIQNLKRKDINLPPYLILKYKGLFENTLAIPAAKEMIDCFLEVLLRIDLSKSLKFLSSQQESELLNWDIEIYRQSIN
jgi:rhamnose utilization protein RhaD (predicted bifunctional aldolase and dehydrogenase)